MVKKGQKSVYVVIECPLNKNVVYYSYRDVCYLSIGKTMTCPRCRPVSKSENLGTLRRQTSLLEQPTPPTTMSFLFLPKYGSKSMKVVKYVVNWALLA